MKWLNQLILPAFSTLYFVIDAIWGLPDVTLVLGLSAVSAFFFGVILFVANRRHSPYGGDIVVTKNALNKKTFLLELNTDPEELENMDAVIFKVKTIEES